MHPRSRRAMVGVLSVLLPAAGIAYLGAVSYREDRGLVAERLNRQLATARAVAGGVEAAFRQALSQTEIAFAHLGRAERTAALETLVEGNTLARRPFLLDANGRLRNPASDPLRAEPSEPSQGALFTQGTRTCPERGFDACVRSIRAMRRRAFLLDSAHRKEVGRCEQVDLGLQCHVSERERVAATRLYAGLARFDDTGPEALLGLARLAIKHQRRLAADYYRQLGKLHGQRFDDDQVSYQLIADLGLATSTGDRAAVLSVYRGLVERAYRAPSAALELIAERLRAELHTAPHSQQLDGLAELDARLAAARKESAFAAALQADITDVARMGSSRVRARNADQSADTLIFRRTDSGMVVGLVVTIAQIDEVAAQVDAQVGALAEGARAIVERVGTVSRAGADTRTLASVPFGPVAPHLTLAIINQRSDPDPLDESIRARGRRHMAITGGLVVLLLVGLVVTIRGAARERELARLKGDFVSTVSHELKTPLTSIRMFGEMLQQDVAGADRQRERRYQDIIVKESQRLGFLIANLLDYSQIERGTRRYAPRSELAGEIMRAAVDTFTQLGEEHRAPVEVTVVEDEVAHIFVDREVVVQALLNLLSNASKYAGEKLIEARVESRGSEVAFLIRDRGPGIPPSEHEKVFREFYRTPSAYSSGVEGTGLGLALVKRHVEAQGGRVELDSSVGLGSTFILVFEKGSDEQDSGH